MSVEEDGTVLSRTPIYDPENVDVRREEMGLSPQADYYEEMRQFAQETP